MAKDAGEVTVRLVRDADTELTARLDAARVENGATEETLQEADDALAHDISHLRMRKDDHEVEQMRAAVAATHHGFEAMIAELRAAVEQGRGERWLEGTFARHARHRGNGVGYDSICAAGDHANTLHWIKNTGEVREGDLVLIDAGVEVDSLYTADITRTLPASGTFTEAQREVYDAVYAAQEAGIAAVKPGAKFSDVHAAAIRVIAEHLHAWGLLPEGVSVDDTLDKDHGQYHRRWMVHGTSHHLGLDVHDCALATREEYMDAVLEPGMVLTVEPGLYFKADDLLAPERFRGIGRAHRGRRGGHRRRLREPVGRDAARVCRRRGLDRRGPGPLTPDSPTSCDLPTVLGVRERENRRQLARSRSSSGSPRRRLAPVEHHLERERVLDAGGLTAAPEDHLEQGPRLWGTPPVGRRCRPRAPRGSAPRPRSARRTRRRSAWAAGSRRRRRP